MFYSNPAISPYPGSPYPYPQLQTQQPRQEVTKVNGENGARAYSMGPNSSALLLDETGTIVWLVTTDGAGYKTVAPFDISPHQTAAPPDYNDLEERIRKLEEAIRHDTTDPANARPDYTAYSSGTAPARADQANDRRHEKRG